MDTFILVFGVTGAGKTTLCKDFVQEHPEYSYFDFTKLPNRSLPVEQLISDRLKQGGNIITEGCFESIEDRQKISKVLVDSDYEPLYMHLKPNLDFLCKRRPISRERYEVICSEFLLDGFGNLGECYRLHADDRTFRHRFLWELTKNLSLDEKCD